MKRVCPAFPTKGKNESFKYIFTNQIKGNVKVYPLILTPFCRVRKNESKNFRVMKTILCKPGFSCQLI